MGNSDQGNSGTSQKSGCSRRKALECMTWAGTGVLWAVTGGSVQALGLADGPMPQAATGLTFLQISDSHIGFAKPVNPNVKGTLGEVIGRIAAMPVKPSFMIHTGDITHLSKASEFDDAQQIISQAGLDTHYVPGEHDVLDPETSLYLERYGKGTKGSGWYSFDAQGVHFMGLVNVVSGGRFMSLVDIDNPGGKAGGFGILGEEQLAWIEDDLRGRSASTPIVVFAHIPLWTVYPTWGWGTEDSARALAHLKRFGSVTVLNGHIHQVMQKIEGNVTFHTALSTAYPQPAPGTAPKPGPKNTPPDKLRTVLGARTVIFKPGQERLAIVDSPLKV
jgi:3',5'-cyclic AMP phosphodiesterase CpdA